MQFRDKKIQVLKVLAQKLYLASITCFKVIGLSSFITSSKQDGIVAAQLSVVPATKTCNQLLHDEVGASLLSITNHLDSYGFFTFVPRLQCLDTPGSLLVLLLHHEPFDSGHRQL